MSLKYLRRPPAQSHHGDMDPLAGMANLFDASIVLIVSMMIALFMSLNLMQLFDAQAQVTITTQNADGEVEIVTRDGAEITVQRVTETELSGAGVRLGTAFQLDDGRVVYVPD
jgi:hypothetical protein